MHRNFTLWILAVSSFACGTEATSSTPGEADSSASMTASMPGTSAPTKAEAPAAGSGGRTAGSTMARATGGSGGGGGTATTVSASSKQSAAGTPAAGSGGGSAEASGNAAGGSPAAAASGGAGTGAGAGAGGAAASSNPGAAGSGGTAGSGSPTGSAGASSEPAAPPKQQATRCIDPGKATPDMEVSFPCDGVNLWVHLPKQCQTQSCGLIFNIHGGGMTDHATMDQATNMIALGSAANYVVVHPHKGTWDVAGDRDAIFDFLQQSIQAFGIDPKRVHSTGYSQGGQLSWALACEHADVVASIAPAEEINRVTDCWKSGKLPAREIPILFAYGHRDAIGGGYDAAKSQADSVAKAWQMQGPETVAGMESANYFRQRWTSAAGTVFEFISHNYTSTGVGGILDGHCLPMSSGDTFVSCATPVDYDWGKEALTFFQAHPLP